jgi:protein-tyrosine phosphatase
MKVLVVCHGNINRSVLCAAVLRHERPDWEVREAALKGWDNPGFRAERAAKKMRHQAMRAYGIDLEEHRSRSITIADLEWADRVIYMDGGNLRRLHRIRDAWHGIDSSRWLSLGSFDEPSRERIPDPNFLKAGSDEFIDVVDLVMRCSIFCAKKMIAPARP